MNLEEFYHYYMQNRTVLTGVELKWLEEDRESILRRFQTLVITNGLVSKYKIRINSEGFVLDDIQNLEKFHLKLLMFVFKTISRPENYEKDPIKSIRMYFDLQHRGIGPIRSVRENLKFSSHKSVKAVQSEIYEVLNEKSYRNLHGLHRKFFRLHKSRDEESHDSCKIANAISKHNTRYESQLVGSEARINDPVVLDGYSARSIIIALNEVMEEGLKVTFMIGSSLVNYTCSSNHGRVFVTRQNYSVKGVRKIPIPLREYPNNKLDRQAWKLWALDYFPYNNHTSHWLILLQDALKGDASDLMDLILERFSHSLRAFTLADFRTGSDVTEEHVHFLNAFSFLIQIGEIARYLKDKLARRPIEEFPIALSNAIARRAIKMLKGHKRIADFDRLYNGYLKNAEEPTAGQKLKENGDKIVTKINTIFESYNNVNRAESKKRLPLVEQSDPKKAEVLSSAPVLALLKQNYGSGCESDSDESIQSFSDQTADFSDFLADESCSKWMKNFVSGKIQPAFSGEIADEHFVEHDVPPDGNCFFHAVNAVSMH